MPIDHGLGKTSLGITGSLRIACGDFHFKLRLTHEHFVADFPSFGMLLRAKTMGEEFAEMIADVPLPPPLPGSSRGKKATSLKTFLKNDFLYAAVNKRPVGKLFLRNGSLTFRPTPLGFLRKLH